MYTINIEYSTGDSFGTYDTEDTISIAWNSKALARKALKAIQVHYQFCQKLNSYGIKPDAYNLIKESAKSNYWYNQNEPEGALKVELDDGTYKLIDAFWCGYFESLNAAEVVACPGYDDDEDRITFT